MTEDPEEQLAALAEQVKASYQSGKAYHRRTIDEWLRIGHLLLEARTLLPSDARYGQWFAAQKFGFTVHQGNDYKFAAQHESVVRALVLSEIISFTEAVRRVRNPPGRAGRTPMGRGAPRSDRYWRWLIAAANLDLEALGSADPAEAAAEHQKVTDAVLAEQARRDAAVEVLGVTPIRRKKA
jgi:hypothetical protein